METGTEARKRTAAFHNLGCKVNAYETEAMEQLMKEAGYEIVPFDEKADVYVINTCSVTNIADRKSRQMIHRARKMNPEAVVVAAGCYVQTARERSHLDVDADVVIGNNRKKDLVRILEEYTQGGMEAEYDAVIDINHEQAYEQLQIDHSSEHTRAFIKVQDGCNQFCSYCIIPYARGRIRSRDAADVAAEVEKLTASGVREVVLTGIHLSSYGTGKGDSSAADRQAGEGTEFAGGAPLLELIRTVSAVPGVERIRLGSLEPRIVTEAFAQGLRDIPQICPHFHLSLQSGSDSVLQRMNRRYTAREYSQACAVLRHVFTDPALTTDVIVGFPGESEEEFAQTEAFLEELGLYETHIFKYSRRAGTRAAAMPGQIPEQIKTKRSARLIALGKKNMTDYIRGWNGRSVQVLFEERVDVGGQNGGTRNADGQDWYAGYTKEYIRVHARSGEDLSGRVMTGTLCLTDAQPGEVPFCVLTDLRSDGSDAAPAL